MQTNIEDEPVDVSTAIKIIDRHIDQQARGRRAITAEQIAALAWAEIDPRGRASDFGKGLAILTLREIAEERLSRKLDPMKAAEALLQHADALDAETDELIRQGKLSPQ